MNEKSKEWETIKTNWVPVVAFGPLAARAKKALKKGDRVSIQGRLNVDEFEDKNGEKRTSFSIIASDLEKSEFLA